MRILMTGATGLVGRALLQEWGSKHEFHLLVRGQKESLQESFSHLPAQVRLFSWNFDQGQRVPPESLEGVEGVIHLMGESVAGGRWTRRRKERLWKSRVESLSSLVEELKRRPAEANQGQGPLKFFMSASAIGFYGDQGDQRLTEASPRGTGFLSDLCVGWEEALLSASKMSERTVALRIGIVLSSQGGFLEKLGPLYQWGLGGVLGHGRQWMSWIHIHDLVAAVGHLMETPSIRGPVNLVAPEPLQNRDFNRHMGHEYQRPALFRVPRLGLKVVLGEASSMALQSQRVVPEVLTNTGFSFKFERFPEALSEL